MLSRIKKAFSRDSAGITHELQLISTSPLFDAAWYAKRYELPQRHAAQHYLEQGGFTGYNPSLHFHSQFYLEAHPDVAESGINPLLHYILHGQAEGRPPLEHRVSVLFSNLWGGHSASALRELLEIAENADQPMQERYKAAWEAARWHSFAGEHGKALALAERMLELMPEHRLQKERVLLVAVSCQGLGRGREAVEVLNQFIALHPMDADPLFFLANTVQGPARLATMNRAYQAHGYLPLALRQPDAAVTFNNITATVPAGYEPKVQATIGKVSVIIPAYNAADKIHIAIESLLNQTYSNLEILVVDDCSPDNTFAVIEDFAARDARVKPLRQSANAGAYAARNLALKHVSGDFITTHDSDDWSHPQKIESQLQALQDDSELVGVMTHWVRSLQDLTITQNWRPSGHVIHWSHSSFLFKREVITQLGEWDQVRIGADTEFIWRVQKHYGKRSVLKILPQVPMAIALDDDGSLTRTKATHVRTVYFGLRHIYRQICDWWHRNETELRLTNTPGERTFPVPRGMLHKTADVQHFDALFVSDFSRSEMSDPAFAKATELLAEGKQVALLHWPLFGKRPLRLRDRYAELIAREGAVPVVFGDKVSVPQVFVSCRDLLAHEPDATPEFNGVNSVMILQNDRDGEPAGDDKVSERAGQQVARQVFGVDYSHV